ncbi:hypothetical protein [Streptococcus sp. sy010]|uniref:hypothetical protein n=1 Tax=Streptococcus sp. sy010 TaxID=2600148 RepID=UPI0011B6FB64|nr:hypothetical protein [Streptococcus sp. sy010]TWT16169.1 hypothetical protein FRX51_02490 [Streptococcus sp. sy010]
MLKNKKVILLFGLLALRVGLSLLETLKNFGVVTLKSSQNLMTLSDYLSMPILLLIIYIAYDHYRSEKR